jgi:hypothetical protein
MSGTAMIALLATTVYFAGFAFYATMSTAIAAAAGILGITLPIGVYTGAAALVAILSGPVGLVIVGLGTAGSVVLLGRANLKKTTAFVLQMHGLKVAALQNSGITIPEPVR